jgi:hypothetical protein
MTVPPGDVATDHAALFAVGGVAGAVEVNPRSAVSWHSMRFIHGGATWGQAISALLAAAPLPDAIVLSGGKARADVVADDRDPGAAF